jgi:hypothetical protein
VSILTPGGLCRIGAVAAVGFAAVASSPLCASADFAPPWHGGDVVGEPTGAVAHVAIIHEDLDFDLRPLADANSIQVRATYQLRNDEGSTVATLVFLADRASMADSTFAVSFDGSAVVARPTITPVPPAWLPPASTPALGDGAPIAYSTTPGTALQFSVVIPSGQHRLSVNYAVLPARSGGLGTTAIWQVGYVLAPARQWASFGDLSVRAQLPAGWRARSIPNLARNGDTLVGHFASLPADSMAFSAAFPIDPHVRTVTEWLPANWPLFLLLVVITIGVGVAATRPGRWQWPLLPLGTLWAFPAAAQWMQTGYVTPPYTQYSGGKCGVVTAGCLLLPGAMIVTFIAAWLGVLVMGIAIALGVLLWSRWHGTT